MREVIVFSVLFVVWRVWRALNSATLQDFFSPFNLLFYFWIAPLIASYLYWSRLQNGLSEEAAVLIAVATAILIAGSLVPMSLLRRRDLPASLGRYGNSWENTSSVRILVVLFFVVACAAAIAAEFSKGIPLFQYAATSSFDDIHRFGKDSKLQILAAGLQVTGMLSFYIALTAREKRTKWLFYALAVIPPLLGVLKTSKSDVFDYLFYYAVLYYYGLRHQKRLLPFKKMAICLLIAIAAFVALTMLRQIGDARNPTLTYSGLIEFRYQGDIPWPANDFLAIPYGYVAMNFENFSRFVNHSNGRPHFGASMLRPFLSSLVQGQIPRSMVQNYEANYHELTGAANMGTYLRDLYFEGGAWFCLIGTILYSALVNGVYVRFRKRQSTLWMCIYINFAFGWIWLMFNNFFAVLSSYTNAAYMVMVVAVGAVLYRVVNQPIDSLALTPHSVQTSHQFPAN